MGIISGVYSGLRGAGGREEGKEERGEKSKITFSQLKTPKSGKLEELFQDWSRGGENRNE